MSVPGWVQDAIFYEIFPDRFADGDPYNNPPNTAAWNSDPTRWSFHGGDLRGILLKLDYLLDLGVNAIYLTPVFLSAANHRYHTVDYFSIDPRLGNLQDFHALLEGVHRHGMRLILDGVFNHCGRGFFAFNDLMENGEHSAYRDWFHVNQFPLDAYSPGDAEAYVGWWGLKGLPKFNTNNPDVRRYIYSVARYWIEQGIDGWRLDVPNEIDDNEFWGEFRDVVRKANPDAYILGEIWDALPRWVGEHTFDGLMNYPFRRAVLDFVSGKMHAVSFRETMASLTSIYPAENIRCMYSLLGSHDTERALTMVEEKVARLKAALVIEFTYPGVPSVLYGDEVGVTGGKDPENRKTFPWDMAAWNGEIRAFVKQLIQLRKQKTPLRRGDFQLVSGIESKSVVVFTRRLGDETVLTAVNNASSSRTIGMSAAQARLENQFAVKDLLSGEVSPIVDGRLILKIPAHGSLVLGSFASR